MSIKKLAHIMTVEILEGRNLSKKNYPLEWDPNNEDSQYSLVYEDCLTAAKVAKKFYKKSFLERYSRRDK